MKKILSILLCLSMLVSVFCVSASAKSPVNIFNVTVEVPQVGNKPDYNAYVPSTASTKVVNVEWKGELDANGCFKSGTEYTVYVTVKLKDEHKDTKYIKYVKDTVKVNGNIAKLKDISADTTQAVVYYTFKTEEEIPQFSEVPETVTQQSDTTVENPVTSANVIKEAHITITPPEIGKAPTQTGTVTGASGVTVAKIQWDGEFDEDGFFADHKDYVAYIVLKADDSAGVFNAKNSDNTFTVNGDPVIIQTEDSSKDSKAAVIQFVVRTEQVKGSSTYGKATPVEMISIENLREPVVGEKPDYGAKTPNSASTYVTSVKWEGTFDENGCFKYGETYKFIADVAVKPSLNMFIDDWYKYNFMVNGKQAGFSYKGESDTEGTIYFTFANVGMPHQNHCFCGGNILLGEHKSHSAQSFQPWDGKSKISYTDNKAFVYLTGDVKRSETLNVPGNKELTICLNGYKIQKTAIDDPQGNRVININSGGKLRLCDCSAMQTGVITGGSNQMGGGIHNGGTLVMYGGKLRNNSAAYGGGLWNNYNFYMYGGEICYNDATYGGGLWNANSGDAQMIIYGGRIYHNEATYGAGVWNNDNGNIEMQGGEISENVAGKCGGGVWNQGKNFYMTGGNIIRNFAQHGAGVWTQSTFTMTGGLISLNEAIDPGYVGLNLTTEAQANGGGVWVNDKSIFQMKGGQISLNKADLAGGGVYMQYDSEFVMQGGTIAGNKAQLGGGVYVQRENAPARFRMSGNAEIVDNLGVVAGGGMYIKGIFETTGGTVSNNFSDSEFYDMAIEPDAEVREGTSLPTEFIDVAADAYFYQPVLWALEKKVTNGTSEITFSPDDKCSTAQILTFLWRAAGSPILKENEVIKFADVRGTDYFYMAAQWAKKNGMVEHYALYPNKSCNRMMSVYYIWCAAGKPACSASLKFTDLNKPEHENYKEAIAWAVEQGITNGTSDTTFSPGSTCTRGQIVTFLWRAAQKGLI